jgi:uroporphyrinogen III methyltransferase / synthase
VSDADLSWTQLARLPGTKVVMMGLRHFRRIVERLQAEGLAPTTPVALVHCGTTPRQRTVQGTLGSIADQVERSGFGSPAIAAIGEVVRLRGQLNWFEKRPLFGRRVVVTRARDQAAEFSRALGELGAEVLELPTIKFGLPTDPEPLVEAMAGLHAYDWLIFTSANGVHAFFAAFFRAFKDLRDLGGARFAAVGSATAAALQALHLQVDLVPPEYHARRIVKALQELGSLENLRVLLLRAEVATPELPRLLEDQAAIVDDVACYRTEADLEDPAGAGTRLLEEGADWITFTSGSTARHFHARFPLADLRRKFPGLRLASIGPETTKALAELGVKPELEAKPHTTEALLQAIVKSTRAAAATPP